MVEAEGERGLVAPARLLLRGPLGYPQAPMLEEVTTPWGRPDLVAFELPRRNTSPPRTLGRGELVLLAMLCRMGPLTQAQIAHNLGSSVPSVRSKVQGLLSRGLVEDLGGTIAAVGRWPHLDSICAIELKLRDWRRGLLQALRYRIFADLVYVFLSRIPSTLEMGAFSDRGIGLASLGDQAAVLLTAKPVSDLNLNLARMVVEENIRRDLARQLGKGLPQVI